MTEAIKLSDGQFKIAGFREKSFLLQQRLIFRKWVMIIQCRHLTVL